MSEIGKTLVFYLKYFPEMQQAFEEGRKLPGVDSAKVKVVGHAAGAEAYYLLTACTADWFDRLESSRVANFKRSRQGTVKRNWGIEIDVRPRGQKGSAPLKRMSPLKRQIGLYLERDELIPWVWSRGGIAIEEKIRGLLPPRTKSFGSKKYGWTGGAIAISPTEIRWADEKDFNLSADKIIKQTKDALEAISPKFIEALLKL
jgi:hypothetical protein